MTVFVTIVTGVCVYIIGQVIMKFVLEPIHAQREVIGKVVDFLIYHANRYTSPGVPESPVATASGTAKEKQLQETKEAARVLASELMVKTQAIPWYGFWSKLRLVREKKHVRDAQRGLFYLSNALFDQGQAIANYEMAKSVEAALGIDTEFEVTDEDKTQQPTQVES